jgi:hypothetical protein
MIKRLQERRSAPITTEEGELLAKKYGCFLYHETSAFTGEGLDQLEFSKMMDDPEHCCFQNSERYC